MGEAGAGRTTEAALPASTLCRHVGRPVRLLRRHGRSQEAEESPARGILLLHSAAVNFSVRPLLGCCVVEKRFAFWLGESGQDDCRGGSSACGIFLRRHSEQGLCRVLISPVDSGHRSAKPYARHRIGSSPTRRRAHAADHTRTCATVIRHFCAGHPLVASPGAWPMLGELVRQFGRNQLVECDLAIETCAASPRMLLAQKFSLAAKPQVAAKSITQRMKHVLS
jgi:hypothetical protein